MSASGRGDMLLEDIARLRRVERRLPPDRDLVAVRTRLEKELGDAVSIRRAARFLGVSHTALRRWIGRGDVPVVLDASSRPRVPIAPLLELRERLARQRPARPRRGHFVEAALAEDRKRAERLDVRALVEDGDSGEHRRAERRSLAYHRALARRLTRSMVDDALRQLWRWQELDAIDARFAARWEELLRSPLAEVRRTIGEDSADAAALRQTSPFAGMLSEPERRKILAEVR